MFLLDLRPTAPLPNATDRAKQVLGDLTIHEYLNRHLATFYADMERGKISPELRRHLLDFDRAYRKMNLSAMLSIIETLVELRESDFGFLWNVYYCLVDNRRQLQ